MSETQLGPLQTSKIRNFVTIVNGFQQSTITEKLSILNVCRSPDTFQHVPACFFHFCFSNTLERFSILSAYPSYSLVQIPTNTHKRNLYVCINSKIPRKIREKSIFQQSADLNIKYFPFSVYHGATPTEPLSYANTKETKSLGKNGCRQKCLDKSLLQACNFIKKRLQHRCFTVSIAKFSRTPILKNIYKLLLLFIVNYL